MNHNLRIKLLFSRPDLFHTHHLFADCKEFTCWGEKWIVLKGSSFRMPLVAAGMRYELPPNAPPPRRDPYERFWDGPRWYDPARRWYAHVPDVLAVRRQIGWNGGPWMFVDYSEEDAPLDLDSEGRLSRAALADIREHFAQAADLLHVVEGAAGFNFDDLGTEYNLIWLSLLKGAANIRHAMEEASSRMLELIGAIAYVLNNTEGRVRDSLAQAFDDRFEEWRVFDGPRLGTILDLRGLGDDPFPLTRLLDLNIPIYVPWDERYRPDLGLLRRTLDLPELDERGFLREISELHRSSAPEVDSARVLDAIDAPTLLRRLDNGTGSLTQRRARLAADCRECTAAFADWYLCYGSPPVLNLTSYQWVEDRVLSQARWFLTPEVEVKLRYHVLLYRTDDVADLLTEALQRGMRFTLAFEGVALDRLAREEGPGGPTPAYLEPHFEDPLLPWYGDSPAVGWSQYVHAAREILKRPHAIAFLMRGGLLWRLALEFGPDDLKARVGLGPSSTLLQHARGSLVTEGWWADDVTPSEVDVLLGYTTVPNQNAPRSWWPPHECFVNMDFDAAEWTPVHEAWFRRQLESATRGLARPLHEFEWNGELTLVQPEFANGRNPPPPDRTERLCLGLELMLDRWNGVSLALWRP